MLKVIKCLLLGLMIFGVLKPLELSFAQEQKVEPQKEYSREDLKKRMSKAKDRVPLYIKMLLQDPNEIARESAILILSRSKDPRAIEPLSKVMLEDPELGIRKMTAQMLSGFKDKKIVPIFKKQVLENGPHKIIGAKVLMKLGDEKEKAIALPVIEKYAEEGHPEVLFYSRLIRYDNKKGEIRENVYYNKKSAERILMKLLKHKDEIIQSRAAYYLLEIGEKEPALSKTEKMLNSSNERIRNIGKAILRKIGDEKSKKRLKELKYQEIQEELRKAEEGFKRKK